MLCQANFNGQWGCGGGAPTTGVELLHPNPHFNGDSDTMRIFLTGASGCIGHYLAESLIQETEHELFLLVRDPAKLKFDCQHRPGVTIVRGDLRQIEPHLPLLSTMDQVILVATAWGGTEAFEVNVTKTLELLTALDPHQCQQVLYFSTASILNRDNQLLPEAGQLGIDYVRSKFACYQQLPKLAIAPRIITLFPTLVFGGDAQKPVSHVSSGIADVVRWLDLIRFLQADASFHFIHAQDIARVVCYLIEHPLVAQEFADRQIVLGSPAITVNQTITEVCAYFHKAIYFQVPLSPWLINLLIRVFRIRMNLWSYFSLQYRHFTYQHPVTPASFGLPTACATIADLLKASESLRI